MKNSFYECYDVEREYQDICKKCAYAAVEDMYSISNIGGLNNKDVTHL